MLYNLKHKNHQLNVYDDNLNLSNSTLFIPDNTPPYFDSNLQNQPPNISSGSFKRGLRFSIKQRLKLKKRPSDVSDSSLPFSELSSKAPFALVPLLLLPYSFNTLALSATAANTIQGTAPYLTFDGGATRGAIFDDLLSIELSDSTRYTATNISTAFSPIVLPASNQTFDDLTMVIPPSSSAITLNDSIVNNGYWGDDDGDGQGAGGVTITPDSITLTITDNDDQTVNRTDALDVCKSPYKVVLSSPNGTLSTLYGSPNSVSFGASTATYYIAPNQPPKLCFAKPNLDHGTGIYAGPASMWNPIKGFIPQSTTPATYGLNFPTTGANGLYFDLVIAGVSTPLTWPDVTSGAVTATMTPSSDGKTVRVLLTGPTGSITTPTTWPNVFELVGSDGTTTLKYGFELQKWYVNRRNYRASTQDHATWCTSMGYRQSKVNDLSNASGGAWIGANPQSGSNNYTRVIGAGLFFEWGNMGPYANAYFYPSNWTSDVTDAMQFYASSAVGSIGSTTPTTRTYGVCTFP